MTNSVRIEIHGLKQLDTALRQLVPEIRGKKGFAQNPLRTATRKGADVIVEAASAKARRYDDPKTKNKVYENIVRAPISTKERDAVTKTGDSLEGYNIGFDKKVWYAIFKELGTIKQPAEPVLRPALEERKEKAIDAFADSLRKSLDAIARKLARQRI